MGQRAVIDDAALLTFLKTQGDRSEFVTSVCGGSDMCLMR